MQRLVERIGQTRVAPGELAIFWIGQAGFVYKTANDKVIYVDPYLTDSVARQLGHLMYGFKRLTPTLIEPEEVEADLVVVTHEHQDHFDADLMPVLASKPQIQFAGSPGCEQLFQTAGIRADRYSVFRAGQRLDFDGLSITGVYADHGELAPNALGVLLQFGDITVWQVGDTAYRPDKWQDICQRGVDILIPPINGAFGNLNGVEAAQLAADAKAKVVIPCHFWMFAEHNGNPAQFLEACKTLAPQAQPCLMAQGEKMTYRRQP
jgi:L-ascorbate 6-phosphate lactonase